MSFLTGPRLDIINEYIKPKKFKNKLIIPIGIQELKLKTITLTQSKRGNNMIVLTIWKAPEEIGETKRSFHTIKMYYVDFRIEQLKSFVLEAFDYSVVSSDLQSIAVELEALKGHLFKCVIRHQKRLIMEDGSPIEKRSFKIEDAGLLLVAYEPVLWKIGTNKLEPEEHKSLIIDFKGEEKEIFNTKLKERFNKFFKQ